jgi:hypothetical protein
LKAAFNKLSENFKPVLFKIKVSDNRHFKLDLAEFSFYFTEKEVLLPDSFIYKLIDVKS